MIYCFRQDIHKKQLKLAHYEEKLQLFKQNFPQNISEKLEQSFNTLISKLKDNGIKIVQ